MNDTEMNIQDYFDFLDENDIRIKGTRIGIETVLEDYLNASSPEEIAIRYPILTLEQVYATITYYFHNQPEVDRYLERWRKYSDESWREQLQNPSPAIKHLLKVKQQRHESIAA